MSETKTTIIKQNKLVDLIPVKKFSTLVGGFNGEAGEYEENFQEVMLVSDIEVFLEKITHPTNLAKLVKAMAFGQKIDFEDLLK